MSRSRSRERVAVVASVVVLALTGCSSSAPPRPTGPPPRYAAGDLDAAILTASDEPTGWTAGPIVSTSAGDSVPGPCDGRPEMTVPGSPKLAYRNLTGTDPKSVGKITLTQYVLVFPSNDAAASAVRAMRAWSDKCPAQHSYPTVDNGDGVIAAHTARTTVVATSGGTWTGFICVRAVTFADPVVTSDDRTLVLSEANAVTYVTMEEHILSATAPDLGAPTGGPSARWMTYVQPFFARVAAMTS